MGESKVCIEGREARGDRAFRGNPERAATRFCSTSLQNPKILKFAEHDICAEMSSSTPVRVKFTKFSPRVRQLMDEVCKQTELVSKQAATLANSFPTKDVKTVVPVQTVSAPVIKIPEVKQPIDKVVIPVQTVSAPVIFFSETQQPEVDKVVVWIGRASCRERVCQYV